jgi:predicted O-methyltransferase YrrM
MPKYTYDTFTRNIPIWSKILDQPYVDYLNKNKVNVLDIGAAEGVATIWFLETFFENSNSRIYSLDTWWQKETEKIFDANIVETGMSHKVVKLKSAVNTAICDLIVRGTKFDVIYYNHTTNSTEALAPILNAFSLLLKDDGVIVLNNYDVQYKVSMLGGNSVHYKEALIFFQRLYAGKYEVLNSDGILALKKLSPALVL